MPTVGQLADKIAEMDGVKKVAVIRDGSGDIGIEVAHSHPHVLLDIEELLRSTTRGFTTDEMVSQFSIIDVDHEEPLPSDD